MKITIEIPDTQLYALMEFLATKVQISKDDDPSPHKKRGRPKGGKKKI